jgi:hypothetical protein
MVRMEGFSKLNNSMPSSGPEPVAFRVYEYYNVSNQLHYRLHQPDICNKMYLFIYLSAVYLIII